MTSNITKLSFKKQFIQQTFIKCSYAKNYAVEMQKGVKFLLLPLTSSHSSEGGFKKQKQYSTIRYTIEVGCNYSGETKKGSSIWSSLHGTREISQRWCFMLGLQGYIETFQVGTGCKEQHAPRCGGLTMVHLNCEPILSEHGGWRRWD